MIGMVLDKKIKIFIFLLFLFFINSSFLFSFPSSNIKWNIRKDFDEKNLEILASFYTYVKDLYYINYYNDYLKIINKLDINKEKEEILLNSIPLLLISIIYIESKFYLYVININKIKKKERLWLTKKQLIDFLSLYANCIVYSYSKKKKIILYKKDLYGNLVYYKSIFLYKNRRKNIKIIRELKKNLGSDNVYLLRTISNLSVYFPNYIKAVYYTKRLLRYYTNIDIGLTQINYRHWCKRIDKIENLFRLKSVILITFDIMKDFLKRSDSVISFIKNYNGRYSYVNYIKETYIEILNLLSNRLK